MARKTSKHLKRRLCIVIGPISILIFAITLYTILSSVYTINKLSEQKELLENNLIQLEEEANIMEEEVEKLKDPEYIAKYAREHYYYTKHGEYVLKFEDTKKEDKVQLKVSIKDYYALGILFFVLFIIFMIIVKIIQKKADK